MFQTLIVIGLGGATGAMGRYLIHAALHGRGGVGSHWAIFAVNMIGCLGIGVLLGWVESREGVDERVRLFLTVGLLGAFTTFSTFAADGVLLLQKGRGGEAILYLAGSVLVGLAFVWAGMKLGDLAAA